MTPGAFERVPHLYPGWFNVERAIFLTFNARAETIRTSIAFHNAIGRRS